MRVIRKHAGFLQGVQVEVIVAFKKRMSILILNGPDKPTSARANWLTARLQQVERRWSIGHRGMKLAQFDEIAAHAILCLAGVPKRNVLREEDAHHLAVRKLLSALQCQRD